MNLKYTKQYKTELQNILRYIHKDKPMAAKNFKDELSRHLHAMLDNPYMYRVSLYADDENVRDMAFKGYTVVYEIGGGNVVVLDIFKWVDKITVSDELIVFCTSDDRKKKEIAKSNGDLFDRLRQTEIFSDRELSILFLKYWKCLPSTEVAKTLGYTVARVKQMLYSSQLKLYQLATR